MARREKLLVIASIITCYLLEAQGADKYTDENRPYEFGFTIDGEQHRHEEKDKNGIIKGEYGFITADNVYHVTVYATDEQGRFKILSMKNIRYADYKGLSGAPNTARQGHSLQLPSPQPAISNHKLTSAVESTPKPALHLETISIEPPAKSCSHCSIPTTSTAAPKTVNIPTVNNGNAAGGTPNAPGAINVGNNQYSSPGFAPSINLPNNGKYTSNSGIQGLGQEPHVPGQQNYQASQSIPQQPNLTKQQNSNIAPTNTLQGPYVSGQQIVPNGQQYQEVRPQTQNVIAQNEPAKPFGVSGLPNVPQRSNGQRPQSISNGEQDTSNGPQIPLGAGQIAPGEQQNVPNEQQGVRNVQPYPGKGKKLDNTERSRSGKQFTGTPNLSEAPNSVVGGSSASQANLNPNQKPVLAYAQMQIVDKNTDIHSKRPGEEDGLPPGLKEDDMLKLLYTFNYTLGFQAHFEEGYTNGEKRGYYYTTGRNGVRTRIDYVADENGFRPTLSQEVFDLISDEVPKEDTEKEEKYGLKGYEFKWLYFPVATGDQ